MNWFYSAIERRTLLTVFGSLVVVLTACTSVPENFPSVDGQRLSTLHQARIKVISSWQLQGKVSVHYDGKLWRSGLKWLHFGDGDRMNLTGPGGRTLMRLQNHPGSASAEDNKGRVYHAESFEELVSGIFGVDVPIVNLRYWATGLVVTGLSVDAVRFNENGSMKTLSQDGWEVRYLRYQEVPSPALQPISLPALLVLSRGDLKLTLAVKHWQLIKFRTAIGKVV